MTTQTLTTAMHTAHVDPMTGVGVVLLPLDDDLWFDLESLMQTDYAAMLRTLSGMGWRVADGDDGLPQTVGMTVDGREAWLLIADEPIIGEPTFEESRQTLDALGLEVGLLPIL